MVSLWTTALVPSSYMLTRDSVNSCFPKNLRALITVRWQGMEPPRTEEPMNDQLGEARKPMISIAAFFQSRAALGCGSSSVLSPVHKSKAPLLLATFRLFPIVAIVFRGRGAKLTKKGGRNGLRNSSRAFI